MVGQYIDHFQGSHDASGVSSLTFHSHQNRSSWKHLSAVRGCICHHFAHRTSFCSPLSSLTVPDGVFEVRLHFRYVPKAAPSINLQCCILTSSFLGRYTVTFSQKRGLLARECLMWLSREWTHSQDWIYTMKSARIQL